MRAASKVYIGLASVWLWLAAGFVYANGGGLHPIFFSSWWGSEKRPLKATLEYDPVQLWSTSVGGKYKLLRVVLENAEDAPAVRFSKATDTFEIILKNGSKVKGILDLEPSFDAKAWDALPPSVRESLVYPAELKPNAARAVYVLLSTQELTSEPAGFDYTIRSLTQILQIRQKPATKA
jgi:hypothetical protein